MSMTAVGGFPFGCHMSSFYIFMVKSCKELTIPKVNGRAKVRMVSANHPKKSGFQNEI